MKKVFVLFALLLFVCLNVANAGLILDLRTSDNKTAVDIVEGTTGSLSIELWATVTGADANNTNDGLQTLYACLKTLNNTGITGLTGFSATGVRAAGFIGTPNSEGTLTAGDLVGAAKASTWSVKTSQGTAIPPYTGIDTASAPASDKVALADGVSLKVGTFTYSYDHIGGANKTASLSYAIPTWIGSLNPIASWAQDNASATNMSAKVASAVTIGTNVQLTVVPVPEPSTLILLGMSCLALLAIRRRK